MPSLNPSIFLGCKNTNARILHLAQNAFRVTHVAKKNMVFPPDRPWMKDILIGEAQKTPEYEDWEFHTEEGCLSIKHLQ